MHASKVPGCLPLDVLVVPVLLLLPSSSHTHTLSHNIPYRTHLTSSVDPGADEASFPTPVESAPRCLCSAFLARVSNPGITYRSPRPRPGATQTSQEASKRFLLLALSSAPLSLFFVTSSDTEQLLPVGFSYAALHDAAAFGRCIAPVLGCPSHRHRSEPPACTTLPLHHQGPICVPQLQHHNTRFSQHHTPGGSLLRCRSGHPLSPAASLNLDTLHTLACPPCRSCHSHHGAMALPTSASTLAHRKPAPTTTRRLPCDQAQRGPILPAP